MRGHIREDRMTYTGETFNGCGKWDRKGADEPKKGEGIGQGKLRGMGMMGGWLEVGEHLGIGEKLTSSSPLDVYLDEWDN